MTTSFPTRGTPKSDSGSPKIAATDLQKSPPTIIQITRHFNTNATKFLLKHDFKLILSTNESSSSLTEYETGICWSLAYFVNAATELVQTELALGPEVESLIKLLTKFYTTVSCLSKYFFVRCKSLKESIKSSRFDTLLHS